MQEADKRFRESRKIVRPISAQTPLLRQGIFGGIGEGSRKGARRVGNGRAKAFAKPRGVCYDGDKPTKKGRDER